MSRNYIIRDMVQALLAQKKAHDALVEILKSRIEELEREALDHFDENMIPYYFFNRRKDLIPEFVETAYAEEPRIARQAVACFHDAYDLSTIPCTGNDFTPWGPDD